MTKKTIATVGLVAALLVLGIGLTVGMSRMDRMDRNGMSRSGMDHERSMVADHMGPMMEGHAMGTGHMVHGGSGNGSVPAEIPGAREVAVTADDLAFTPSSVSVKTGEAVNVRFHNADEITHDLTIPALGIHVNAQPGETVTFGLPTGSPGTYDVLCTVPGHAAAGMRATITVTS